MKRLRKLSQTRFVRFGLIGAFVFILGLAGMYIQVSILGIHPQLAFFVMAVISVETNFLLNRRYTWGDRAVGFWRAFVKFNASRMLTIPLGQALFALLLLAIPQYLIATVVHTIIFTIANYAIAHCWAFRSKQPVATHS